MYIISLPIMQLKQFCKFFHSHWGPRPRPPLAMPMCEMWHYGSDGQIFTEEPKVVGTSTKFLNT